DQSIPTMAAFLDRQRTNQNNNNYYYCDPESQSAPQLPMATSFATTDVASSLDDSLLLPPDAFLPSAAAAAPHSVRFVPADAPPAAAPCRSCRQLERDLARQRRELERLRRQQLETQSLLDQERQQRMELAEPTPRDWDDSRDALATRAAQLEAENERLRADAELRERRLALQSELLAEPSAGGEAAAWRPRLYKALVQAEAERWAHDRQLRQTEAEAEAAVSDLRRRLDEAEARAAAAERKLAAADRLAERLQSDARRLAERRAREASEAAEAVESARAAFESAAGLWMERLTDMEGRLGRLADTTDQLAASEKLSELSSVSELRAALSETRSALDSERQARRLEAGRHADALDASAREQAKLAAALAQSERRLQREREAAEAQGRQAVEDFQLATERLRDRLRLVEGERNLLQAAAAAAASEKQQQRAARPHSAMPVGGSAIEESEDPRLHAAVRDLRQMLANSG
ncbi:hypothetical protein BOX15_Mlig018771g4, partial [Macrostomum lignano]